MFIGQDTGETNEWDRFWGSGRVEDYLRYKNCSQEEKPEKNDTGFFTGDGNCAEIHSCWRI
ncbi:MAG: hypothetical protein HDQ96_07285 [Lachnospiraceae bacterium]|nr:hypothetical protein [Lachnospiraceae bacterium]